MTLDKELKMLNVFLTPSFPTLNVPQTKNLRKLWDMLFTNTLFTPLIPLFMSLFHLYLLFQSKIIVHYLLFTFHFMNTIIENSHSSQDYVVTNLCFAHAFEVYFR